MSNLLDTVIAAHGGWERWQQVTRLTADASIGGLLWQMKGRVGVLDNVRVAADPRRQHVEYSPFRTPGQHSVYEPERTAIETNEGSVIEARESPREAFAGHGYQTPWDDQHLVYFSGYAMWTYLTTPFLFRLPGFQTEEIDPWDENGEEWRRLKVIFPPTVHSHSPEQVFYFDTSGLLRRHDYSVDIIGGTSSANYATEHKAFGGIIYPTKRRVFARGPDNRPLPDRIAIAIDFHDIEVTY
jgi:hypothetical protein